MYMIVAHIINIATQRQMDYKRESFFLKILCHIFENGMSMLPLNLTEYALQILSKKFFKELLYLHVFWKQNWQNSDLPWDYKRKISFLWYIKISKQQILFIAFYKLSERPSKSMMQYDLYFNYKIKRPQKGCELDNKRAIDKMMFYSDTFTLVNHDFSINVVRLILFSCFGFVSNILVYLANLWLKIHNCINLYF